MKRTITTQSLARGFAGLLLAFALTGRQVLAAEPQLVLDKNQPSVNQSFSVTDMLPGDAVEEQYTLQVHRSGVITLLFDVIVTDETGDLGEALNIQVTDATAGTALASGTFDQVRDQVYRVQLPDGSGRIDRDFTIRVWMDTSVGNEYQNSSLEADFRWYVEGEPAGPDEPAATPAPGQLIPAQTGDPSSLALWIALAAACALALAFIRIKTKGGRGQHE